MQENKLNYCKNREIKIIKRCNENKRKRFSKSFSALSTNLDLKIWERA